MLALAAGGIRERGVLMGMVDGEESAVLFECDGGCLLVGVPGRECLWLSRVEREEESIFHHFSIKRNSVFRRNIKSTKQFKAYFRDNLLIGYMLQSSSRYNQRLTQSKEPRKVINNNKSKSL